MPEAYRGVATAYHDAAGRHVEPPPATIRAVLDALGPPPAGPPPVYLLVTGQDPWQHDLTGEVALEEGDVVALPASLPGDLPLGYHRLVERDGRATPLVVAPPRAHLPDGLRDWGVAVQLYALRSRVSWGIGDIGDLARLAGAAGDPGFVLVSPLHAPDLSVRPIEPSPYYATSRRLRNPLHIEVPAVAEWPRLDPAVRADLDARGRALTDRPLIDRDAVWSVKEEALRHCYAIAGSDALFPTYLEDIIDAQLAALPPRRVGLIADLALGSAPGGLDHHAAPATFLPGLRIGAPPDPLGPDGQDWGLPVPHPERLADGGYAAFAALLRGAMRHAGGLRIDHVMGLHRLFVIPDGATATDGTYLHYPAHDLLAIVALESLRARCLVIGEDLGTVEPAVRAAHAARGILSTRLARFEPEPPDRWPAQALAAVTTHDLPTSHVLYDGDEDRIVAVHGALGESPCMLTAVTADDLFGAARQPNVPGTIDEHPNWRIPLPGLIEDLAASPLHRRLCAAIADRRSG
jgi:4-alpha-glucanotransferase